MTTDTAHLRSERLNEREFEILASAEFILRKPENGAVGWGEGWFKCLHVGGSSNSHHNATLMRLVKKGLVEVQPQRPHTRHNRIYRITKAGFNAFKSEKETLNDRNRYRTTLDAQACILSHREGRS